MRYFLQLTRVRDGAIILCNLDHIESVTPADLGCNIVWVSGVDCTQVKETYEEVHGRIQTLLGRMF